MAVKLGQWTSARAEDSKLRFEKARKTALGIAQGVVLSDLDQQRSQTQQFHNEAADIALRHQANLSANRQFEKQRIQAENRQKSVEQYLETPFEKRGALRKFLIANDPSLASDFEQIDADERARRFGTAQPISTNPSGVLEQANPQAVAAATPVPISQAETVAIRGPAFNPENTGIMSPTSAAIVADKAFNNAPNLIPNAPKAAVGGFLNRPIGEYLPGEAFERGLETTSKIPYAGESIANQIKFLTSPLGIGTGLVDPTFMTRSAAGAVAGSTLGGVAEEELGAPTGTQAVGELTGMLTGPLAVPAGQVAAGQIAKNLGQAVEREGGISGLLASEQGGTQLGKELAPWEQAASRFVEVLNETPPIRTAQETLRTAERGRRIAKWNATFASQLAKGKSPEEAYAAARKVLGGELPYAEFPAGKTLLSSEEGAALWQRAAQWEPPKGFGYRKVNLGDAMRKIMVEGKLPQENEIRLLRQVFGNELADAVEKKVAEGEGAWNLFLEATGLPKAFLSSFDLSYPGRQGIMTSVRHPKEFFGNFGNLFKAAGSERGAAQVMQSIYDDATPVAVTFNDGRKATLPFGEIVENAPGGTIRQLEAPVSAQQQRVLMRWLETRPIIGPLVAGSQRAFAVYGNKLRTDIAKYWIKRAIAKDGTISEDRLNSIFNLSQRLTGQGTFGAGPGNRLTDGIAALGWSPFYRIAPLQVVASLFHKDPFIRRMAAENLVSFVGAGLAVLGGLKLSGAADVEDDPRSSDFGKIKIGDQRINFWGTNQLLARSVGQIITGERKSLDSGLTFPQEQRKTIESYLRSGLAPEWSLIWDTLEGKTGVGREVDFTSPEGVGREGYERLVPLALQDIIEAASREGVRGGLTATPLAIFGVGVQTFGPNAKVELSEQFKSKISERELAWVEDLLYYTELRRAEWREQGIDTEKVPFVDSLRLVGTEVKADPKILEWAILLRKGSKTRDILTGKFAEEAQKELETATP